jgi:hypothetical protein
MGEAGVQHSTALFVKFTSVPSLASPSDWSNPAPLLIPLCPLGSFCVIYFLRRVCIIFSHSCSSSCWKLRVLFFWRAGWEGHFVTLPHLSIWEVLKL